MSDLLKSESPGFRQLGSVELTLLLATHKTEQSGATLWTCDICGAVVGPNVGLRRRWHDA